MGRAPCCEKTGLRKGKWTEEEDEILVKYIAENGEGSWRSLPEKAGLLRCGKSCRLRWINYLKDGVRRGNFSMEEDEIIIKFHASYGNRWSLIAGHLPGRTDNEIKNYWNSHLSRRLHRFCRNGEPIIVDLGNSQSAGKRRRRGYHTTNKSSVSTPSTLEPTNSSALEEQSQMIRSDHGSDSSNINNGAISFDFDLIDDILPCPLSCCDSHANWECLEVEEEMMKEKVDEERDLELEDMEALLCGGDEMVEASPWL